VSEALVLRAVDFGESDRIVHLLTPDAGRVTAIAKGAKRSQRRFPGTLDVFNRLRVQLAARRRPGTLARLEHARLLDFHPGLRTRPARFALACYLVELLDRLAPEGAGGPEAARLYRFAADALRALEAAAPDARLRVLLELRALDALGLRPELRHCVRCGREPADGDASLFHVGEGGPVCGACGSRLEGLLRIHRGTLRALEQGLSLELSRLDRLVLPTRALVEAEHLVDRFQRFHVGIELASARFLREMIPLATARDDP